MAPGITRVPWAGPSDVYTRAVRRTIDHFATGQALGERLDREKRKPQPLSPTRNPIMAANVFHNAINVAKVAAELAGLDLGLGDLVHRDLASDFNPGSGRVVSVRVPGAVASTIRGIGDKTTPITLDEVIEQSIDVTLTDHVYNAVSLSEADISLDLKDFAKQVLKPQVSSIVRTVEAQLATAMKATPETLTIAYAAATPAKTFTAMRAKLRAAGVSADEKLVAVVGSGVYGDLLDGPAGTFDADGKVRGVEVHENTRFASDEIIVFVRSAFALVVRAPVVPQGVTHGASVTEGGFAIRAMSDYDASVAADRSLVGTFVKAVALPLPVDGEAGTVNLVANGGAVRVLTSTIPV